MAENSPPHGVEEYIGVVMGAAELVCTHLETIRTGDDGVQSLGTQGDIRLQFSQDLFTRTFQQVDEGGNIGAVLVDFQHQPPFCTIITVQGDRCMEQISAPLASDIHFVCDLTAFAELIHLCCGEGVAGMIQSNLPYGCRFEGFTGFSQVG